MSQGPSEPRLVCALRIRHLGGQTSHVPVPPNARIQSSIQRNELRGGIKEKTYHGRKRLYSGGSLYSYHFFKFSSLKDCKK